MPKERFFRLPEEKQKRICRAAYEELAEVSYDDLSINRIVQRAGIPRGSFYQYFDDKEDLLFYLMKGFRDCVMESIRNVMEESAGDIFCVYLQVLRRMVEIGIQEDHYRILKHIFSGLHVTEIKPFEVFREINEGFVREMYSLTNVSRFQSASPEEFMNLIELLSMLTRFAGAEIFADITRKEIVLSKVALWMEMLKYGVLKKEEQEPNVEV